MLFSPHSRLEMEGLQKRNPFHFAAKQNFDVLFMFLITYKNFTKTILRNLSIVKVRSSNLIKEFIFMNIPLKFIYKRANYYFFFFILTSVSNLL